MIFKMDHPWPEIRHQFNSIQGALLAWETYNIAKASEVDNKQK